VAGAWLAGAWLVAAVVVALFPFLALRNSYKQWWHTQAHTPLLLSAAAAAEHQDV
jgi:hypothetical protein